MSEEMLALLPLLIMLGGIFIVGVYHDIRSILDRNKFRRGSYFKFKD